jgi:hypothetical protein
MTMDKLVADLEHEFRRHKRLAEAAMAALDDAAFFHRPATAVNPVALIAKHLGGNLLSRWTDFLTTDGDKPGRNRDNEFVLAELDTRTALLDAWERGWQALFATLGQLRDSDMERIVTIRGEPHTVRQALLRACTHAAYHVGQILYVARMLRPGSIWLTIAPGTSGQHAAGYRNAT